MTISNLADYSTLLAEFVVSLPPAYTRNVEPAAVVAHAKLAQARGTRAALAGTFESQRAEGQGICVVAVDRPGLLAATSAALVMCGFDVVCAEAYTRRPPSGVLEALYLFWVRSIPGRRRAASATSPAAIAELNQALCDLLQGRLAPAGVRPPSPRPPTRLEVQVRFVGDTIGGLATLEVKAADRPGLLLALSSALFEQDVQIVGSRVRTSEDGTADDRFSLLELDGSAISPERRLTIQVAVLSAIEATPHVARARAERAERAVLAAEN